MLAQEVSCQQKLQCLKLLAEREEIARVQNAKNVVSLNASGLQDTIELRNLLFILALEDSLTIFTQLKV